MTTLVKVSSQGQITIPASWLIKLGVRKKGQKVPAGTTLALVEEDGKMIVQEAKNRAKEGFGILKKYVDPSLLGITDEELEQAIENSKTQSFKQKNLEKYLIEATSRLSNLISQRHVCV